MYRIEQCKEFRPRHIPSGAEVVSISISPDQHRIAFFSRMAAGSDLPDAIIVESLEDSESEAINIEITAGHVSEMKWSPDGTYLAYCLIDRGTTPCTPLGIRWEPILPVNVSAEKSHCQTTGICFAWMPSGDRLAVASSAFLRLVDVRTGVEEKIADLNDDGDPFFTPKISVSRDGQKIAYTTRRTDENISRVWIAAQETGQWESRLQTLIPGAFVFISPFWSPDCTTLGLHMVHPKMEKSSITIFQGLAGEGEIIYESPTLDPWHEPSWIPSGEGIIFFHTSQLPNKYTKPGPVNLALLTMSEDCLTGKTLLAEFPDSRGMFRFIDNRKLVLDGSGIARVMVLSGP